MALEEYDDGVMVRGLALPKADFDTDNFWRPAGVGLDRNDGKEIVMGDPNTGRIYNLGEGESPEPGHVPLTTEQAATLSQLDTEVRKEDLRRMVARQIESQEAARADAQCDWLSAAGVRTLYPVGEDDARAYP